MGEASGASWCSQERGWNSEAADLCSAEKMPVEEAGARMMLGSALMAAK